MNQKKPIPVKYFYYGMIGCVILIGAVFFFLWNKEANEEKLLRETGIKTEAWVTRLYQQKGSGRKNKHRTHQHLMDVIFFADTTIQKPLTKDTAISKAKNGSELVDKMFNKMHANDKPIGDYKTATIAIGKGAFEKYKIDDKVKIVFVKDNPEIARLAEDL